MNEEVKRYLQEIIDSQKESFRVVPEYAFSVEDYIQKVKEIEGKVIARRTARERLKKLVDDGKIVRVQPRTNFSYFVPKTLAHNVEIDKKAIMDS